jgi:hypothetical protein
MSEVGMALSVVVRLVPAVAFWPSRAITFSATRGKTAARRKDSTGWDERGSAEKGVPKEDWLQR